MDYFVIKLIDMGVQAGIIVCFVLALRILFRRMNLSAGYLLALWAIPFFLHVMSVGDRGFDGEYPYRKQGI